MFEVISSAYERTSLIVTTNLPFENWTDVLRSERITGATLDRLTIPLKLLFAALGDESGGGNVGRCATAFGRRLFRAAWMFAVAT